MSKNEQSSSGYPIYRHGPRTKEFQLASGDAEAMARIEEHIEAHIGKIEGVYHEIISDLVHVDIFIVAPTPERNYYTLVTCGMSNLPMTVPEGAENFKYAELMICLPPTWQMTEDAFQDENHYWPMRCLKQLARFPHEYDTWLFAEHTIPNGDPAEPYAHNTKLSGMMLTVPSVVDNIESFFTLTFSEDKEVHFFSLLPLYKEEMELKINRGAEALYPKLEKAGINEILNPTRKNVCKKTFWIF